MGVVAASPPELVGRADAWSYLQGHLEAAFDGRGGAVRVVADAGVGKSALLEALGRSVAGAGAQVLTTQGRQSEEHLTFAALHRLIEPLWEHRTVLPPGHQTALADAFGLTDEERVPQRFFVALAVLELLTAAAASTPLVAIVDDRQWLDSATRDVIDFIARRVAHEPILIVYGERPSVDAALPPDDLGDVFALRVLEPSAAEQLLDLAYPALAAAERAVVLEAAGGNPLALIELPRSPLGGDPRSGRQSGQGSVSDERSGQADPASPVAHRLREVFLARVAALPDDSRLALLVAALQDADTTVEVLEAVATTPGSALTSLGSR